MIADLSRPQPSYKQSWKQSVLDVEKRVETNEETKWYIWIY